MLPGNPDFFGEKKLRAGWQEIQTFLRGESSLGTTLTGPEPSIFTKGLDFLGRDPIIFGINTKIGNFKPKCIFWEGVLREMGLDLMENGGWRWSDIWGKRKIGFGGSYGMVWRSRGGNLHEISTRMQWDRSRGLTND